MEKGNFITEISTGLKRKCYSIDQIKSSKRKCLEKSELNILHLSDCILLNILQYLDVSSLFNLSLLCTRFNYLVKDESLWVNVDGRVRRNCFEKTKNCFEKTRNCVTKFCWKNVNKRTKKLLLSGDRRSKVVLLLDVLTTNRLNNLSVLALENQCIKYCKLSEFPRNLEELSFKRSFIPRHKQFFRFSESNMAKLKTLILDHCRWFDADCLTSICKYPKLEILSLYMCKKLSDDDISSISLAGKFGFKNLKVVDLRFTSIGDLFIKTFYGNSSLQIIYFQCFASTYYLERYKRLTDIHKNGQKILENSYVSDSDDNNTNENFLKYYLNADRLQSYDTYTIKDHTMEIFNRLEKTGEYKSRPSSFLYKYPYDPCTCGFFNRSGEYSFIDPVDSELSSDEDLGEVFTDFDIEKGKYENIYPYAQRLKTWIRDRTTAPLDIKLKREIKQQTLNRCSREGGDIYFMLPSRIHICNNYVFDSCITPDWTQMQARPGFEVQKWLYAREPRNDFEISMLENTDKHLHERLNCRLKRTYRKRCKCFNSNDRGANTIIITRNADGSMSHVTSNTNTVSCWVGSTNQSSGCVENFINQIVNCIETLKTSANPQYIALTVVQDILSALDECLKKQNEYSKLQEDECFVRYIFILLHKLSKLVKHDIRCVLKYHQVCFRELLKQIEDQPDDSSKKAFLISFFTNFLYSEGYSKTSDDHSIETTYDKKHTATEELNRPGPSGLHLPKPSTPCSDNTPTIKIGEAYLCKSNIKSDSDSDSNDVIRFLRKRKQTRYSYRRYTASEGEEEEDDDTANVPLRKKGLRLASLDSDSDYDSDDYNYHRQRRMGDNNSNTRNVAGLFRPNILQFNDMVIHIFHPHNERDIPTNIKELSLRGYPHVTDRTLTFLKDLDLNVLDVTGTNVTRAGAEQFMLYNPHCQLIHESACVCRPRLHF